jgi:hypothetical protein
MRPERSAPFLFLQSICQGETLSVRITAHLILENSSEIFQML